MKPKIELCSTLARYMRPYDRVARYQFKIVNRRRRAATDIKISVSALFPGLIHAGSIEIIRLREHNVHWLPKHGSLLFRIQPGRMAEETRGAYIKYFPEHLVMAISSGTEVDLIEFLSARPNSSIRIDVSSTDSIASGTSHVRCIYTMSQIETGRFQSKMSCGHTGIFQPDAIGETSTSMAGSVADSDDTPVPDL